MRILWKRTPCAFSPVPMRAFGPMFRPTLGPMFRIRFVLLLTAVLITALLTGCSTSSSGTRATPTAVNANSGTRPMASGVHSASLPMITVTAYDDFFVMPKTMAAGLTDVTLVNAGAQPHQAAIGRVKPGVTVDQVLAAAKRGSSAEAYLFSVLDFVGGPNAIAPHAQQGTILNLRPGHYVALCFVPGPDGRPHYQMGMITPFTVTTASGQPSPGEPSADVDVRLVSFGFAMPATFRKGDLVEVVNQSHEVHEMVIVQPAPGKTAQDILAWAKHPALPFPFVFKGGMAELAPGATGWLRLSRDPGQYLALCFVTDPATGKPHFMLGMIAPLSVQV